MRRFLLALPVCAALAAGAAADPTPTPTPTPPPPPAGPAAPATVKGRPGVMARLTVPVPDGKMLVVKPVFDDADDTVFDELVARPGTRRFFLETQTPGRYAVLLWFKGEDDAAVKTVFDIATPAPPAPQPAPAPPVPADPLAAALRAAFAAEPAADKAAAAGALASLYRAAAKGTVRDPSVKTYQDLFADLKTASSALLAPAAVPGVRKVVGDRFARSLGTSPGAAVDRDLAAAEFAAVAAALEDLK